MFPHSRIRHADPVHLPAGRRSAGDVLPADLVPDAVPERRRLHRAGRGRHWRRGVLGPYRRLCVRRPRRVRAATARTPGAGLVARRRSDQRSAGCPDSRPSDPIFSSRSCARSNDGAISSASSTSRLASAGCPLASSASAEIGVGGGHVRRLRRQRAAERPQRRRRVLALQRQPPERGLCRGCRTDRPPRDGGRRPRCARRRPSLRAGPASLRAESTSALSICSTAS